MKELTIKTQDGEAPAWVFRPTNDDTARLPGILFYMDAIGPREALFGMAQRLADAGYVVLMPDLFYRYGKYGPFTHGSFADEAARNEIMGMIHGTSYEMTARDNVAFMAALEAQSGTAQFGAVGYCFGGGRTLSAAAAYPQIVAAASFHGGNLASDDPASPHRSADKIKAQVYVGMAGIDGSFPPAQSALLTEAFRVGGVDFAIENYVGKSHGWTVPDRDGVYDHAGAERHWNRLLSLFEERLGA
jgi:carboxymethylenebutenolidase